MDSIRGTAQSLLSVFTLNYGVEDRVAKQLGLGAKIPPELFPFILRHASTEDHTEQVRAHYEERLRAGEDFDHVEMEFAIERATPRYALESCSLVCRYWANQCRKYMFKDAVLRLQNIQHAEAFRRYALQGSKNLTPIHKLVRSIDVAQFYVTSPQSFLDLVHIPAISKKFGRLRIVGPAPPNVSPSRLDTPHWSRSNLACLTPAITPYKSVYLGKVHLPSFNRVVRYLKHFRNATDIRCGSVTWDDKGEVYLPRPIPTSCSRPEIRVEAHDCTDNFLIAWQTSTMYSDSPLHTIADRDQQLILLSLISIRDYYQALARKDSLDRQGRYTFHSFKSNIGELSVFGLRANASGNAPSIIAQFFCDWRSPVRDVTNRSSPKPLRILGVLLVVRRPPLDSDSADIEFPDIAALRNQLEHSCALRIVVFVFDSYPILQRVMEEHASLLEMWPHVGCAYRFACRDTYEHPFPDAEAHSRHNSHYWEVNPVSLDHTDNHWETTAEIVPWFLAGGG